MFMGYVLTVANQGEERRGEDRSADMKVDNLGATAFGGETFCWGRTEGRQKKSTSMVARNATYVLITRKTAAILT